MEQRSIELRLAIIAILLPLFFDTLPNIIRGVSFFPLTFVLPLVLSYILGASWFFVLIAGLSVVAKERTRNNTKNHSAFEKYFGWAVYLTKAIIFAVFSAYLISGMIYIIEKLVLLSYEISLFLVLAAYSLSLYILYIKLYDYLSD